MENKSRMLIFIFIVLIQSGLVNCCDEKIAKANFITKKIEAGRLEYLGSGTFGSVYRTKKQDPNDSQKFIDLVVKIQNDDSADRFIKEAQVMRLVQTPERSKHVPFLHECFRDKNNKHFLIMDYVKNPLEPSSVVTMKAQGETESSYIEFAKLPPKDRVLIYAQIADGLSELHAKNITHGDLKPDSIMMDKISVDGTVSIIDFNGSAIGDERPFVFTFAYLDHEFVEHYAANHKKSKPLDVQGHQNGPKQDIFALAVTIYNLENSYDEINSTFKKIDAIINHQARKEHIDGMIKLVEDDRWIKNRGLNFKTKDKLKFSEVIKTMVSRRRVERPTAAEVARMFRDLANSGHAKKVEQKELPKLKHKAHTFNSLPRGTKNHIALI
jgi:serine/threonine protein kinase